MYKEVPLLPQRTTSPLARRLHAQLHDVPGYHDAYESPRRVAWTLNAIAQLPRDWLSVGVPDALEALYDALPDFAPKFVRHLSIDQLCKIVVEVGRLRAYQREVEEQFERELARR
jgi:hypothetical protein